MPTEQHDLESGNAVHHPALDAFAALLQEAPDAGVVTDGDRWLSRRQIDAAAGDVADRLHAAGLQPGALAAIAVGNGPAFLAALLAVWRRGAVAILIDAAITAPERNRVATTLGAHCTVAADGFQLDAAAWDIEAITGAACERLTDAAVIKMTSGSSGTPRGIVVSAQALLADARALASGFGFDANDRFLCTLPLSHSYGLSVLALPALTMGTALIVPRQQLPLAAAAAGGATIFPTVPSYLRALLKPTTPAPWPPLLRQVITAGEMLPPAVAADFERVYGL
ncbi:MAG: AMP-binding protein, partial [Planctomycetota bacterium]